MDMRRYSGWLPNLLNGFMRQSATFAGLSVIAASPAAGAATQTTTPVARMEAGQTTASHGRAGDELSTPEIERFQETNGVQELPFASTLASIRTCLRQEESAVESCLDIAETKQACETSPSQCAHATGQAWQLYISHYLRLLGAADTGLLRRSQAAWVRYVDAECARQEDVVDPTATDGALRNIVGEGCLAGKARERALELREALVDKIE
jgi:uncharacterized protein YecT (DUF1311 family)